jgi:hypothetical protein
MSKRAARVQALRALPYREYLKTDHWREVRGYALALADYRCERCGAEGQRLDVHHLSYDRRGCERLGREEPDVIVLCRPCHRRQHGIPLGLKVITVREALAEPD